MQVQYFVVILINIILQFQIQKLKYYNKMGIIIVSTVTTNDIDVNLKVG